MAKIANRKGIKKVEAQQSKRTNRLCDECKLSEWVEDLPNHMDVNGKPICLRCPNEAYIFPRGSQAKSCFVEKINCK